MGGFFLVHFIWKLPQTFAIFSPSFLSPSRTLRQQKPKSGGRIFSEEKLEKNFWNPS